MIGIIFQFANQMTEVRIDGNNIYFRDQKSGGFGTIECLQLNRTGVIKEFPDLKDNKNWKEEAIKRFKEKIKSLDTENQKMKYIVKDLQGHGYIPRYIQKPGHRVIKLNGGGRW